jgi:hypothetical protein
MRILSTSSCSLAVDFSWLLFRLESTRLSSRSRRSAFKSDATWRGVSSKASMSCRERQSE